MGDLDEDTAIERVGDGRYRATLRSNWQIWGPMGGYVAAVALRAAGAQAALTRPSSFYCHYLRPARFAPVELEVVAVRRGRTAESLRVLVRQDGKDVMDATVGVVAEVEGLEHEVVEGPDVPGPEALRGLAELLAEQADAPPPMTFWTNFDARPVAFRHEWPPPGPEAPRWQQWHRFVPVSTFEDLWLDAARYVLLGDLPSWPSTVPQHAWRWAGGPPEWIAPTLDLYVAFHRPVPAEPWLLVDGAAPVAADGLLGWHHRLWSTDGALVASGGGQGIFRRVPASS